MQQRTDLYKPSESIKKNIRMSIFEETTMMSMHYKSRNMGQGFPDWETPKFVRDYLVEAIESNENQYTRVAGHPNLVNEIAKTYSSRLKHDIDPLTEITIANGASGILNNAIAALVDRGDEIIFFEPVFEVYITLAEMHGVKPVFCALNEPREDSDVWTVDFERLESCFSDKTRMIFINTPHNPTGTILKKEDIEKIIRILDKYPRVIVLADEVYEHNVFNGNKHLSFASFPGMWERTLSVYSGGKIFSCTGWRVGWGIGPSSLVRPLTAYQNWSQFCVSRPTMVSFASALKFSREQPYEDKNNYYEHLTHLYGRKKDELRRILSNGPFECRVLNPEGGYFVITDITKAIPKIPKKYFYKAENDQTEPVGDYKTLENPDYTPDHAFTRWLTIEYGVTPLPMFTFFNQEHAQSLKDYRGSNYVRWTICKSDETVNAVAERLTKV